MNEIADGLDRPFGKELIFEASSQVGRPKIAVVRPSGPSKGFDCRNHQFVDRVVARHNKSGYTGYRMPAYFDTNVIRYLRTGLDRDLSVDLQDRILVSPISAIEVLSQIEDENTGAEALESIHHFRHWLSEDSVLLDWLEPFYAHHVFGIELQDEIFPIVAEMLDRALAAENVYPKLREGARELRRINQEAKLRKAQLFQQATERLRAENLQPNELDQRVRRNIALGLEHRVGAAPGTRTQAHIERSLAAYCEFHRQSILRAIRNPGFRFDSREHLNDHFDGEQLLYLAGPENHFITSDGGFNCATCSLQGARVHIIVADALRRSESAAPALERVVAGCAPVRPGALRE